jgi:hypothetical protein
MPSLRRFLPFFSLSFLSLLFCNDFNNPYDTESPNHVSDSTLVRYVTHTIIDTTIVADTIIHIDTVLYIDSSTYIDTSFYIDTVTRYDTLFDTVAIYDSIGYIDTVTYYDTVTTLDTLLDTVTVYDSVGYIDTLHVFDTTVHVDTTFDTVTVHDTATHIDTVVFADTTFDTVTTFDTLVVYDTTVVLDTTFDTLTVFDTLTTLDTLFDTVAVFDTTFDTITVPDTVWTFDTITVYDTTRVTVYDTVIVLDTLIDTIFHYNTDPFIYWVTLPDSNPFTSFVSGSTYTVGWAIKGINPALVQSYSYKSLVSGWNNPSEPFTRTFTGPDAAFYYLRAVTDSGTFANYWTVGCNPASLSAPPTLDDVLFYRVDCASTWLNVSSLSPCTLHTAGQNDFCFGFEIQWDYVLGKTYEHLFSSSGDYSLTQTPTGETGSDCLAGEEVCLGPVSDGQHLFVNFTSRYVAPDTSSWAPWVTICVIVDFDPCP